MGWGKNTTQEDLPHWDAHHDDGLLDNHQQRFQFCTKLHFARKVLKDVEW